MSLINCPECGKEISDSSEYCIGCGYPSKNKHIEQDEEFEEGEYEEEEDGDGEEEKETIVSIMSLITYVFYVISSIIKNNTLAIIFAVTSIVLTTIAHFQKGKCTCAGIVVWIMTIGFVIAIILAFLS